MNKGMRLMIAEPVPAFTIQRAARRLVRGSHDLGGLAVEFQRSRPMGAQLLDARLADQLDANRPVRAGLRLLLALRLLARLGLALIGPDLLRHQLRPDERLVDGDRPERVAVRE